MIIAYFTVDDLASLCFVLQVISGHVNATTALDAKPGFNLICNSQEQLDLLPFA